MLYAPKGLTPSSHQHWTITKGPIPLIRWQIDFIGHRPVSEGYRYAMIHVDMATGLLVAFPTRCAHQQKTKRGLEHLSAACGRPQLTESDQGTHFTGHTVKNGCHSWESNASFMCHTILPQQA